MGLGILEDNYLEHVPGTSVFNDDPNASALSAYEGLDLNKLKHGSGKNAHLVLVPQPSDDPNDPLNWPQWQKHTVYSIFVFGTVLCGALGPLVSANLVEIATEFNRSDGAIARALGSALVLALAFATVTWSVISVKFGKRPVFLVCTVMMLAGSLLAGFTSDYNMLLGSRILQGVGQAVLEFLVGASIADIYFVHERGVPVALWNLALLNGINITPPIAGQVSTKLGWRFCFRIFTIACAVLLVLQFFFMPETTFKRSTLLSEWVGPSGSQQPALETSGQEPDSVPPILQDKKEGTTQSEEKSKATQLDHLSIHSVTTPNPPSPPKRQTYWQSLAPYSGIRSTSASWFTLFSRPYIASITPVCLWAGIIYGVAITWLVLIATGVAQIFSAPPYSFTPSQIGLTYMSPFVFAFIAALLCGPLTDLAARKMSRANNGIFEPEFRLVLVVLYAIFGSMGFFGWGISAVRQDPFIGPVIFFGIINFGVTFGASAAIGYVVDSHRNAADSALGGTIFFKNMFSFVITLFVNDWIAARGILNVFGIAGGVTLFTCLLTIPMYIYGKRARSWIHRNLRFSDDDE